jgi:hypothetical protein
MAKKSVPEMKNRSNRFVQLRAMSCGKRGFSPDLKLEKPARTQIQAIPWRRFVAS